MGAGVQRQMALRGQDIPGRWLSPSRWPKAPASEGVGILQSPKGGMWEAQHHSGLGAPTPPKEPRKSCQDLKDPRPPKPGQGLSPCPQLGLFLLTGVLGDGSWPPTAAVSCKEWVRSPATLDLSSPLHTSLWSVDVVSVADPDPGQEAVLGGVGAAERPRQAGALR